MILRMESSLTRTLKTKERLCFDTIDNAANAQLQRRAGRTKVILLAAVEVSKEAQEGILGIRPQISESPRMGQAYALD